MANAKSTTPALRFKGFDAEWEECPLKKVADKVVEKNINLQITETFTNSAEFGIISQRDYFDHDISNSDNIGTYYIVQNEDFVYNPRISTFAPVGPINRNKLGRSGVMSPLYTVFRPHDIDNTYLEQYFKGSLWHSFMKLNGDSGARSDRFSIKDSVFIEMPIPYPDLNEQAGVGKYFQNLDSLIALQRRKLVKLQNVKKAMLQKMFPTRGSTTPQIRFAGFTEPWQERKLGDISDVKTGPFGSTLHAGDYVSEGVAIITTEHFKNGELPESKNDIPQVSKADFRRLHAYVLKTDDIVFSRVGSVDINALITPQQNGWLFSGRVLRVRSNKTIDSQYLHYELSTERARNDVIGRAVGQTMPSINTEILKQTTLYLPTKIAEQIKIGAYFKHLDTRILLQQRKLEKLQNIKKACLAAMFV